MTGLSPAVQELLTESVRSELFDGLSRMLAGKTTAAQLVEDTIAAQQKMSGD